MSTSGPSRPRPPRGPARPATDAAENSRKTRRRAATSPQNGRNSDHATRRRAKLAEQKENRANRRKSFAFGGLEFSVRFLGIALLAGVIAVMLVPSLFAWWQQERELATIRNEVAAAEERNAEMERQLRLWDDPQYLASQARSRLGYVKPGEVQYVVVDPGEEYQDDAQVLAARYEGPARPWVHIVAISLQEADRADPRASVNTYRVDTSQSADQVESGDAPASAGQ